MKSFNSHFCNCKSANYFRNSQYQWYILFEHKSGDFGSLFLCVLLRNVLCLAVEVYRFVQNCQKFANERMS